MRLCFHGEDPQLGGGAGGGGDGGGGAVGFCLKTAESRQLALLLAFAAQSRTARPHDSRFCLLLPAAQSRSSREQVRATGARLHGLSARLAHLLACAAKSHSSREQVRATGA